MKHDTNLVKFAVIGMYSRGVAPEKIASELSLLLRDVNNILRPNVVKRQPKPKKNPDSDTVLPLATLRLWVEEDSPVEASIPHTVSDRSREKTIKEMMDIRNYDKYSEDRSYSNMVQRLNKKMGRAV